MSQTDFCLVTLNTWKCEGAYRQRLALTAKELNGLRPDMVALQECFQADGANADTAGWLAMHGGLHAAQVQARRKQRAFEGSLVPSSSGMAMLCRQPWLAHQALPLPSSAADGGRVAQIVTLQAGQHTLRVANLHLSHLSGTEGAELRALQLHAVLKHLQSLGPAGATLLCGDFNGELNSPGIAEFMASPWGLVDTFTLANSPRDATFINDQGQGQVLDHVLLAPSLSAREVDIRSAATVLRCDRPDAEGVTPSDHSGLMVQLSLA
ncbi:endonuclease/exonuclease/phosphatase family metal-dependent hydrolase [Hydrogenophaga palleronii]|uniref:Endonuclease/exonuclease/phosphatase family metal-dependent hydrolase n=1 Tax=Hydrogenophaga palleronii TaxID=65655 RepID=A0ABU1WQP4_9BURK|nr:endonuclease/exonuclease/phosphatase family protein [Hydrogenophaga palleronii]MDR7151617.1 endonuclease/exonuclease/phosphatase family metal-dependent hydrolase [Hydrogenophaga palleronii]